MANRKSHFFYWLLLALVPLLGGAAFFSLRAISRTPAKIDPEKLATVERIDLARSVVATGKIQPTTQVEIKSKASGIILKLPVNVGDTVHQGQTICELDQNDLLPKLRQAQAAVGMAEAALKSAEADYERNKVDALGPDVPFLKRDMDRARQMFQEMLAPQTARDDAEKNYQLARQPAAAGPGESGSCAGRHRKSAGAGGAVARGAVPIRRGRAQRHHCLAHRRRGAFARSRSGRRRQLDPGDGVGGHPDHDRGRPARGLREGQSG